MDDRLAIWLGGFFDEYYDKNKLDENSQYSSFEKKDLVVEAEHLKPHLVNILEYIENGGSDINKIKGHAFDGIYESRI